MKIMNNINILNRFFFTANKVWRSEFCCLQYCAHQIRFTSNVSVANVKERSAIFNFDKLNYQGRFRVDINESQSVKLRIKSLSADECIEQNKVTVEICANSSANSDVTKIVNENFLCVRQQEDICLTTLPSGTTTDEIYSVNVALPIKFDIQVVLKSRSLVTIDSFESNNISVDMQQGSCTVSDLKAHNISLKTEGDIAGLKTVYGQLNFQALGNIKLAKVRAGHASIKAGSVVDIDDIYTNTCQLQSTQAHVKVGNSNGRFEIMANTGLILGCHAGDVDAVVTHGNVDAYIQEHKVVKLTAAEGNVVVKLPPTSNTHVDLTAKSMHFDDSVKTSIQTSTSGDMQHATGHLAGLQKVTLPKQPSKEPSQLAVTATSVDVKHQDWLSSLRLPFMRK